MRKGTWLQTFYREGIRPMPESKKSAVEMFVDNVPDGCRLCKNFGTVSCPAFQAALDDFGLDAEELAHVITQVQDGQDLNMCENG